jgi:hypothetical protein
MASSPDPIIAAFEELYEKHGGDCIAIFAELDEAPAKALANAPKSAREFALRYIKGDYTATETNRRVWRARRCASPSERWG